MYSNSLSRQREVERERMVAQRRDAENKRQAAIRQQREEEAKAEDQRTAQELTARVKREQEEAAAQIQAQAKANAAAANKAAAQRAAAQSAAQAAAGQTSRPGANMNAASYQKLNGLWSGVYACAQGQTAAQLLINATPQGVTAVMAFAVPNSKPGSFLMSGTFAPANGQLALQFVRWGNHPANYIPANLAGTVNFDQHTISGRVLAPGCTNFLLRRP